MGELPGPRDYEAPDYMEGYWARVKEDAERLAATALRELVKIQERKSPQISLNLNEEEGLLAIDHSKD